MTTARIPTPLVLTALGLGAWYVGEPLTAATPDRSTATPRDPRPVAAAIDRAIDRKLAEAKIPASPVCDDAEFIRRLSLDIRGRVPPAERVAAFLADADPEKRRKLIDEFLADPAYGEHFATVWYHRMAKPDMDNLGLLTTTFRDWLAEQFNAGRGWDRIARDILTAEGDRDENPATVFWLAQVEGNQQREVAPNKATAAVAKLFLGVRLECCECHDHPFDSLKQTDFWGVAAFFTATHAESANKKDAKAGTTPSVREGATRAKAKRKAGPKASAPAGSIVIPDSKGKTVQARFLLGDALKAAGQTKLRPAFTAWLTAPKNPYFAPAAVNKLWANFFGRGLVDPIDDIRPGNESTHPDLLKALAAEFVAAGFDQRHLIRCVCNSQAYQRTSQPLPGNKADEELYSHMRLKVMTADVLFDSLRVVLDHDPAPRPARGKGAAKLYGKADAREEFRRFFHAEADDDAGIVEEYGHGIPQVLRLMNSKELNNTAAVVARVRKAADGPDAVIEGLYLRALARRPTAAEAARVRSYVAGAPDADKAYGDLLWVLLNSGEFLFNH
jgi:hypothetical protein